MHIRIWCSVTVLYVPLDNPPVMTTHPIDTTVLIHYGNESATFSCEANGGGSDIEYSWYTSTGDSRMIIEGATSIELVLTPITIGMNGTQYYCVASNNSGSSTSDVAHLTVNYAIGNYHTCISFYLLCNLNFLIFYVEYTTYMMTFGIT